MAVTTISSRAFNQDTGRAKKAAAAGPVFITDRGKPSHVLLSIEDYRRLAGGRRNITDLLAMPGAVPGGVPRGGSGSADAELDLPPRTGRARPADLFL